MQIPKKLTALGAFFVLALALAGCGSGIPGNSVASVAGNPITTQAFNHWMYVASKGNSAQSPGAPVIVPTDPPGFSGCIRQVRAQIPTLAKTSDKELKSDCKQLFTSLSSQVMDFLIKGYWYQAEAHKLGIKLSNKAINAAYEQARKQQFPTTKQYEAFLSETGQTDQDIIFRVRVNKAYSDLLARYTKKVTTARIDAYYKAHPSQFGTPASRNLRIVRTNSESQANAAKAALQSGQSWQTVAKKYSVDTATNTKGGLLTNVTNGSEEKALNTVAFSSPLNKIEGPVHGTFGWYVVEVIKITPGTHQSLAQATPLIKQLLTSQYQTAAETKVNKAAKKAYGSQTQCRPAYSMDDCAGYKAPKTSSTVVPSTSGTSTGSSSSGAGSSGTVTVGKSSSGKKKK